MKFSIERERLLKPLQRIGRFLNNRSTIPILNNILLKVVDSILFLTSTDLEIEIIAQIKIFQLYNAGAVTVPARKFFNICRSLPDGAEMIVQLKGQHMLVQSDRSRYLLSTLPAIDYPNFDDWQGKVKFVISQSIMKRLIESTQFSMAHQDVRYYLNGMLFESKGKQLRTVATDGHRLAICTIPIDIELPNHSVIIPRKGIAELMRMLNNDNTQMCVQIGINNIRAYTGDLIFTSKLVDGRFPDYQHVLPKKSDKILELNCDLLRKALIRVAIILNEKCQSVCLHMKNNQLKITSNNLEQEEAEEILDVNYIGPEMEIGLNINYILDVLNTLKCKNVRLLLSDSTSSIQIEDVASKNATYVVMPIKL